MFMKVMRPIYRMAEGDAGGAAGGVTPPWYEGFDVETKGYMQTRGYDKKKPEEAFLEVAKAHREAERFVGSPADKLLRIPDERTTDTAETKTRHAQEWEGIHQRLGKPKEAKDYDFTSVKRAGDKPLDAALTDAIRAAAFNANVSKDGAVRIATELAKHFDAQDSANAAQQTDKLNTEKTELQKNWGNNHAANKFIAEQAAQKLGIDPAAVTALEGQVGYAKVMEMFRNIGTKIGEDRFVNGGQGPNVGPMTREQAVDEKRSLMADKAWTKRYTDGGVEEGRKMTALNKIISGV